MYSNHCMEYPTQCKRLSRFARGGWNWFRRRECIAVNSACLKQQEKAIDNMFDLYFMYTTAPKEVLHFLEMGDDFQSWAEHVIDANG